MIDCIRHGIKDYGQDLKLAYNKPVSSLNQMFIDLYDKNIFTVSRQVYYSSKNNNSIDMMLSLNGLPMQKQLGRKKKKKNYQKVFLNVVIGRIA